MHLLASNSSLRFLIPNLHPICTCSCLFTTLTEGRSARDLTQAATSKKKTPLCDAFPLEGIPVSLCYCIGKIYKKMHYMVGYDGCLHEACGCSLDSPPVYNPMHLRPSLVRVCRACFSLPLEPAELPPEFDL